MKPIEVLVIAERGTRVCASCANGRTWEEVTSSLERQLRRNFGRAVSCRFVDLAEAQHLGIAGLSSGDGSKPRMPLVAINGRVLFRGFFSPTFIRREVKMRLDAKEARRSQADAIFHSGEWKAQAGWSVVR